ncbi:golgin subfamily A member 6-like protein 22 [Leptopilina boulardi]|uniref:golgin subfamily A member 6-like protein 22 n=1 Tax=Leptopilina boulardi TaxID=63433 RepID=UPI0021F599C4|nr:golgin subfamily A member 6-like protein 22 [Leptopilina boulardi]
MIGEMMETFNIVNHSFTNNKQLSSTIVQQDEKNVYHLKTQIPRKRTNAQKQKDYRERKKIKLKALLEQNKSEKEIFDKTKQKINNNKNIEEVSCEMSFFEENKIKIEPHVKIEMTDEIIFQENNLVENYFQNDRIKQEKIVIKENANEILNNNLTKQFSLGIVQQVLIKQKKFKSNAEKQKAYRERKKIKLNNAILEQSKSENFPINQEINDKNLINSNEENNLQFSTIKQEINDKNLINSCVNENKKKSFSEENNFQFVTVKQEIEELNDTEELFIHENNFSTNKIKQEPNNELGEENIFNYNLTEHFQLLTNQETCQESIIDYRRPMSNAEKQKAYRERKKWKLKTLSEINNCNSDKINQEIIENEEFNLNTQSSSVLIQKKGTNFIRKKKSLKWQNNAEKQRAYRRRKKLKLQALRKEKELTKQEKEEKDQIRKLKQREKQKRYREKQKILKSKQEGFIVIKLT